MCRAQIGHRFCAILISYIMKHSGFLKISLNFSNNFRFKEVANIAQRIPECSAPISPDAEHLPCLLYNSVSLSISFSVLSNLQALFEFHQLPH